MDTIPAKSLLIRNKSTAWFGCEYNMNLYRGCCHGCLYCDSRSDCYHVDSFDRVRAKQDAMALLQRELARKATRFVAATGAMSDPYNPFEAENLLSRHALELFYAYGQGIAIATKSDLITRDIDILQDIAAQSPVLCKITITTTCDALAAKLEPRAPAPTRRLAAVERLAQAGLFTGILLMPVLPFLTDGEDAILDIVHKAAARGARFIYPYFGLTMRAGQREYLLAGLDNAFPEQGLAQRYQSHFGDRYHCPSPRAKQLWASFTAACQAHGLLYDMREIVCAYRQGRQTGQLSLFDELTSNNLS